MIRSKHVDTFERLTFATSTRADFLGSDFQQSIFNWLVN